MELALSGEPTAYARRAQNTALTNNQVETTARLVRQPRLPTIDITGDPSVWSRLQCGHHDGLDAVGLGRVLRRLFAKPEPRDHGRPDTTEARFFQQPEHLSLRESTSDSAGPELGVIDY